MRGRSGIAIVVLGLLYGGCADPYRVEPRPAPPAVPSPTTRDAVVRAFATRWVNWTWQTVPAQQRALALLATPGLARVLRANGSSARIDAIVTRDRPGVRGHIIVVRMTSAREGIVLTQEQTLTDGHPDLGGEQYRVYRVSTRGVRGKWKVSRWAPQQ